MAFRIRGMAWLASFALGPIVVAACGRPRVPEVCVESRGLRCMTPVVCAYDSGRGCQVCRCSTLLTFDPRPRARRRRHLPRR